MKIKKHFYFLIYLFFISINLNAQTLELAAGINANLSDYCDSKHCRYQLRKTGNINDIYSYLQTVVTAYGATQPDEFIKRELNNTSIVWWFHDEETRKKVLYYCLALDKESEFFLDHSILVTVTIYHTSEQFYSGFRSEVSAMWNVLQRATEALAQGTIGYSSGAPIFNLTGPVGQAQPARVTHGYSLGSDGQVGFEYASRSREVNIGALLQKSVLENKIKRVQTYNLPAIPDSKQLNMYIDKKLVYRDAFTATDKENSGLEIGADSVRINGQEKGTIRFTGFYINHSSISQTKPSNSVVDNGEVIPTGGIGVQAPSVVGGNSINNVQLDLFHGVPTVIFSSKLEENTDEKGKRNFVNRSNVENSKMTEYMIVIEANILPKKDSVLNDLLGVDTSQSLVTTNRMGYDLELTQKGRDLIPPANSGDFLKLLQSMEAQVGFYQKITNQLSDELSVQLNPALLKKEYLGLLLEIEAKVMDSKTKKKSGGFFSRNKKDDASGFRRIKKLEHLALQPQVLDFSNDSFRMNEYNNLEVSYKFSSNLPQKFKEEIGGGCGVTFDLIYVPSENSTPLLQLNTGEFKKVPCE